MRYLYIDKKALHVLYSKYTTYPLSPSHGQRTYMEEREVLSGVLIFLKKMPTSHIISPIDILMQ